MFIIKLGKLLIINLEFQKQRVVKGILINNFYRI